MSSICCMLKMFPVSFPSPVGGTLSISSSATTPEAIASSVGVLKAIHQFKIGGDDGEKHQLRNLFPGIEAVVIVGMVEEFYCDAPRVSAIYRAISRKSVLDHESRLALDEAHIPLGDFNVYPRVDGGRADFRKPTENIGRAPRHNHTDGCIKVESCIGFVRSCGHISPFV